jgi:hypothetical protein
MCLRNTGVGPSNWPLMVRQMLTIRAQLQECGVANNGDIVLRTQ